MNLYEAFETSKDSETDGITILVGEAEIDVARAGGANSAFAKIYEELTRPHRRALELGLLPESMGQAIMIELYARACVKGWRNVKDRTGKLLEFTLENVIKLFKELPALFAEVRKVADDYANFRSAARQEDAGNS